MRKLLRVFVSCVLSLFVLGSMTGTILAQDSNEAEESIIPKIEVQEDDWLIISYGAKINDKNVAVEELNAYLSRALQKMNPSSEKGSNLLSGDASMSDTEQQDTHGSYVTASFVTNTYWSTSPASFYGTSSAYWMGSDPYYIDIGRYHMLESEMWLEVIQSVPSGWSNSIYWATSSMYRAQYAYYLGTAWNGLTATYGAPNRIMNQRDTLGFDFPSGLDPVLYPSSSVMYGG